MWQKVGLSIGLELRLGLELGLELGFYRFEIWSGIEDLFTLSSVHECTSEALDKTSECCTLVRQNLEILLRHCYVGKSMSFIVLSELGHWRSANVPKIFQREYVCTMSKLLQSVKHCRDTWFSCMGFPIAGMAGGIKSSQFAKLVFM